MRGRQKLVIVKEEFAQVIADLETKQKFNTLGDLWKAVENTDWAKNLQPRPLTAQVAYLRAREMGIVPQTSPAARGQIGTIQRTTIKRAESPSNLTALIKEYPAKYKGLVNRASNGSMKAAIKLKCLDCCAFDTKEIRECNIDACSLYKYRPFQKRLTSVEL